MKTKAIIVVIITTCCQLLACPDLHAQSNTKGSVLIHEDFEGTREPDPAQWGGRTPYVPGTWERNDGAVAFRYDPKEHPERPHARSIDPKFSAFNVRISYRVKFEAESSSVTLMPNLELPPKSGFPIWHIGAVIVGVAKPGAAADVSMTEYDFTTDKEHPEVKAKKLVPKGWQACSVFLL